MSDMSARRYLTIICLVVLVLGVRMVDGASSEGLSHAQVVAMVACMQRTASDHVGDDLRLWRDDMFHMRYSIFRDPNEGLAGWHLVYVLVYNPNTVNGWIYKLYVRHTKPMIEIGEFGTVKKNQLGRMEIDDVWGGLATHEVITNRLRVVESAPLIHISSKEAQQSQFRCYDSNHPSPE